MVTYIPGGEREEHGKLIGQLVGKAFGHGLRQHLLNRRLEKLNKSVEGETPQQEIARTRKVLGSDYSDVAEERVSEIQSRATQDYLRNRAGKHSPAEQVAELTSLGLEPSKAVSIANLDVSSKREKRLGEKGTNGSRSMPQGDHKDS